jgi:hypothetical protein
MNFYGRIIFPVTSLFQLKRILKYKEGFEEVCGDERDVFLKVSGES